jgi:hypothetical protein
MIITKATCDGLVWIIIAKPLDISKNQSMIDYFERSTERSGGVPAGPPIML